MADSVSAWLAQFRQLCQVDSIQFSECWEHYDSDSNGYIDGDEIDSFFNDLLDMGMKGKAMSSAERARLKDEFMREFDENKDGKIEMAELAKILPSEETFLTIFRNEYNAVSSKDFMKIWRQYATNRRDYIEAGELKHFLGDLFRSSGKAACADKLSEYSASILRLFDANGDGKLSFKEMSRLLPAQENVLLKFKDKLNLTPESFDQLFNHYDQDGNGSIAGDELDVFLRDVALVISKDIVDNPREFSKFKKMMLATCDQSGDGSLQKDEVALWLGLEGM